MTTIGETTVRRPWRWGVAVVGDPAAELPSQAAPGVVTIGTGAVLVRVRHAQDTELLDGETTEAEVTCHVRVVDEPGADGRAVVCDVVLETPSGRLTLGDPEAAVAIEAGGAPQHRLVVSADELSPQGLAELWIDVLPVQPA